jgi:hypothetical protein
MSEHAEQAAFVSHVLWTYASRADFFAPLFFAVPNGAVLGGKNKFALLNKLKQEGFRVGVSDLLYLQPRGEYSCLAIEMKDKGGKVSDAQDEFLQAILRAGGLAEVCYSADEAIGIFGGYMGMQFGSARR